MLNKDTLVFLKQLAKECQKLDVPAVPEHIGRYLFLLTLGLKAKSVLEIGCAYGYSTIWLGKAVQENGGHLTSVEMSSVSFKVAEENIKAMKLDNTVELQFGNAKEVVPTIESTFDLVFVDGQKAEYSDYYKLLQDKLSPNAVIAFDNVKKFPEKTNSFLELVKEQKDFEWVILPVSKEDDMLVMRKK